MPVHVEQIYTGCLAEAAYFIVSNGEAAVIDPLREPRPYLERARDARANIKFVLETHFHADFVSGHVDLATLSGGQIVFGPTATPAFECIVAEDNQVFKIGDATLTVLHTPGHTMESSSYLLKDETGKPIAVFTGDTLFIGDVGRPDLAQQATSMTQEQLASHLFTSLRTRLMTLPDDVTVYPGHGAGSACGKNMSKETYSTIGEQKLKNYALRADMTEAQFIEEVLDGLRPPPRYFPENVAMNKGVNRTFEEILKAGSVPLTVEEFKAKRANGAIVVDSRTEEEFARCHVRDALFVGTEGPFGPWVATVAPETLKSEVILVVHGHRVEEVITRLARVGIDQPVGYLVSGMWGWCEAGEPVDSITWCHPEDLYHVTQNTPATDYAIVDVRKPGEYNAQHIETAQYAPLDQMQDTITHVKETLEQGKKIFVYCEGGYRSTIFISGLMKSCADHLKKQIVNVEGGLDKVKLHGRLTLTNWVCPNTLRKQRLEQGKKD